MFPTISRRKLTIGMMAGLACVAMLPVAQASARPTAHTSAQKKLHAPTPPPPPTLAEQVASLGKRFPAAYGGEALLPSGVLRVYVVAAHAGAFLHSVSTIARSRSQKVDITDVRYSWVHLNAVTNSIAKKVNTWRAKGVILARWGPVVEQNSVLVQLRNPSRMAIKELRAEYGSSGVIVSAKPFTMKLVFKDRYGDTSPFYGGDLIYYDPSNPLLTYCTDSFLMLNSSGDKRMLSAGHCGSRNPWYTNLTSVKTLGNTSGNWLHGYGGSTDLDIQSIAVNGAPYVWGNGSTTYNPYETYDPVNGDKICFDGATTTLVCGVKVTNQGPFCETVQGVTVCRLGEATSSNVICQGGDSGGPVFQRATDPNIKAAGSITAGNPEGTICDYTRLSAVESVTGLSLYTP